MKNTVRKIKNNKLKNSKNKCIYDKSSEEQIIKSVLNGNQKAFTVLVKKYEKLVINIALRFFKQNEDILDFSQDVFLRVYENLSQFRFESKFNVWLYKITYNMALNKIKQNKPNKQELFVEELSTFDHILETNIFENEIQNKIEREEIQFILLKSLSKIPDVYKVALELFYFDDLSIKEVSYIMNCNINTVKTYLFRGKTLLKEILQEEDFRKKGFYD